MKLVWDKVGERFYETGCDHGVLYPIQTGGKYNKGVAWNGLSAVTESPSGAEPSPIYADNIKYLNMMSAEDFGGTIEAYTYPDEFAECDGSVEIAPGVFAGQQSRKQFGLSYRTILGMMSIQMTMVINFIWCMDVWLLLQRKVIRPKMTARNLLHFLGSLVQLLRRFQN